MNDDPFVDPHELAAANARCDLDMAEHGIDPSAPFLARIRCAWNPAAMIRRGTLTDRKISQYAEAGFYSAEFRKARKEHNERKNRRREGNFDRTPDGRMIYRPV
jgi:hypothetical protein